MKDALRKCFPRRGRPYELFDCSVLIFVLAFFGYVLSVPNDTQEAALEGPFRILPEIVWGGGLSICAAYGIFASYFEKLVESGYAVTIVACFFWAALYFVSIFVTDASNIRVFILVVLYGWIGRRLWSEEDKDYLPS